MGEKCTEWHLYALFGVEDDRRVILGARSVNVPLIESPAPCMKFLIMELMVMDEMRKYSKTQRRTFILYHEFGDTHCRIGRHLDRPKVPRWKS